MQIKDIAYHLPTNCICRSNLSIADYCRRTYKIPISKHMLLKLAIDKMISKHGLQKFAIAKMISEHLLQKFAIGKMISKHLLQKFAIDKMISKPLLLKLAISKTILKHLLQKPAIHKYFFNVNKKLKRTKKFLCCRCHCFLFSTLAEEKVLFNLL
jgi:hypothetical protein